MSSVYTLVDPTFAAATTQSSTDAKLLIDSRRKRERVWAGALLHNFLAKTVSETTHARYLTVAASVAALFRRVEPACNTEMH